MKRETLLRNLEKACRRILEENLPVEIVEVQVFGSFLRGKPRPHDMDLRVIYGFDEECWEEWLHMVRVLEQMFWDESIGDKVESLWRKDIPFKEVAMGELRDDLKARGVNPVWASCFSWTNLLDSSWSPSALSWEKVVRRRLLRGMKGIRMQFVRVKDAGESGFLVAENFRLAWSREHPDVRKNLEWESEEEMSDFLKRELDHLSKQLSERVETNKVLELIYHVLREVTKADEVQVFEHPLDEILALRAISGIPKYEVEKPIIRKILRRYGLPEDQIVKSGGLYWTKKDIAEHETRIRQLKEDVSN